MEPADLRYWRELQGCTRKLLADLLSRKYITVAQWENGAAPIPTWLPDWLEYMEFEIGAGRGAPACPKAVEDIRCILYASARQARELKQASSARWKAAGKKRKAMLAERTRRRLLREKRRKNALQMERNKLGLPSRRKKVRTEQDIMRDMALQLQALQTNPPPPESPRLLRKRQKETMERRLALLKENPPKL